MLDRILHAQRLRELQKARHGVSVVFGIPLPESLENLYSRLRDSPFRQDFVDRLRSDKLHITILRSKSSELDFTTTTQVEALMVALKGMRSFELQPASLAMELDGALRLRFGALSPPTLDSLKAVCRRIAPNGLALKASDTPWLTLGTLRSNRRFPDHEFADWPAAQDYLFEGVSVTVSRLVVVRYHDIGFEQSEILGAVSLGMGSKQ